MRYLQLIVLLTAITFQTTYGKCRRMARQNPAWAGRQNMYTLGNKIPTLNRRLPVETAMPVNGMNVPFPYTRYPQECPRHLEKPCPRVLPEMRIPEITRVSEIRMPEIARVPEIRIPEAPVMIEMPGTQYVANNMPVGPIMTAPAMFSMPEVFNAPVPIQNVPEIISRPIMQERLQCPHPSPKALVNPFLPAASPVSAWAPPTSNLLPPVTVNQGRTHFLRKIPIPPPTL